MRHNQETLGNGCVCDSGCEACDRLAEAFEAMRDSLSWLTGIADGSIVLTRMPWRAKDYGSKQAIANAREALRLADKVTRGR